MTKHPLAGAAAVVLMSGVAFGETNPPAPPPSVSLAPPPAVSSPGDNNPPAVPGSHEVTIHKEAGEKGNTVIEKDSHREGIAGSTESRTKTETDRDGGTTTIRSKTTTKQD
jgi:hypothetical protein